MHRLDGFVPSRRFVCVGAALRLVPDHRVGVLLCRGVAVLRRLDDRVEARVDVFGRLLLEVEIRILRRDRRRLDLGVGHAVELLDLLLGQDLLRLRLEFDPRLDALADLLGVVRLLGFLELRLDFVALGRDGIELALEVVALLDGVGPLLARLLELDADLFGAVVLDTVVEPDLCGHASCLPSRVDVFQDGIGCVEPQRRHVPGAPPLDQSEMVVRDASLNVRVVFAVEAADFLLDRALVAQRELLPAFVDGADSLFGVDLQRRDD